MCGGEGQSVPLVPRPRSGKTGIATWDLGPVQQARDRGYHGEAPATEQAEATVKKAGDHLKDAAHDAKDALR